MTLKLRYYAPAYEIHEQIVQLLKEVRLKHGIEYEVMTTPENEVEIRRIYREEFISRAKVLKARIGESVAKALRSQRGRGYIYLKGTIALVSDGKIEWFACYSDPLYKRWKLFDERNAVRVGFLKMLLEKGVTLLTEIMRRAPESEHEKLITVFKKSGMITGDFHENVPVGKPMIVIDKWGKSKKVGRKLIDIICDSGNITWVLEAEPELNAASLGQAIIYKELYARENPTRDVKSAIVCNTADEETFQIAKKYVDEIFVLGKIIRKGTLDWSR